MSVILVFLSMALAAEAVPANFFETIGGGIAKEAIAVKQPVLETVVDITFKKCETVKKLFGLQYTQMEKSGKEPDLNELTLKYVTQSLNISLNINSAVGLLPKSKHFNRERFVIYVHGFADNPNKRSFGTVSKGFLRRHMYNLLALDGSSLIRWFYLRSTTYVRFMGEKLGSILADLVNEGLPASSIHIVGHSLGAHISGFTGKQFQKLTGQRVGRITGLDPAGPCFSNLEPELKLSAEDADFVDVIHTNGGVAGLKEPVGHVDYYPNGGEQQPSCLIDTCSHSRAWELMAESLHDQGAFPAVRCNSWEDFKKGNCDETSYMGIASQPGTKGKFYLQTADSSPFGLGANGTQYVNNEGIIKNIFGR
ncbi:hypothetical protein evm_001838 [Chilo suppressalis]|nr:hypothetical protein evm_001838 [Chilo suppressalis]